VRSCKNSQHWVSKKEQHIHETFESDILLWRCWSWWLIRTMWHAILSSLFFWGGGAKFSYWRESKGRCKGKKMGPTRHIMRNKNPRSPYLENSFQQGGFLKFSTCPYDL
jgi:hypothetical protein